jgi:hypothetical protein
MMVSHAKKSKWKTPLTIAAIIGSGWFGMQIAPRTGPTPPANSPAAVSSAQRLANDVVGTCNVNPSALSTKTCGDAAEVAVAPIHDGRDGKDGRDGINGVDGQNGRDGSAVKAQVFKHVDGTSEYCSREGGTDLVPIFACQPARIVKNASK